MSPANVVCRDVVELLSDYLDGTLPRDHVVAIDHHLAGCEGCSHYLDQLRATIRISRRIDAAEIPAELEERLLRAFHELT